MGRVLDSYQIMAMSLSRGEKKPSIIPHSKLILLPVHSFARMDIKYRQNLKLDYLCVNAGKGKLGGGGNTVIAFSPSSCANQFQHTKLDLKASLNFWTISEAQRVSRNYILTRSYGLSFTLMLPV